MHAMMSLADAFGMMFFFFKQKTAYEMRISDWSSDVCSSDVLRHDEGAAVRQQYLQRQERADEGDDRGAGERAEYRAVAAEDRPAADDDGGDGVELAQLTGLRDRKSVVSGKSVSVRVALGGRRIIQKKTK